ncbi:delta-1-pyrroline-5-carboxylate synthetase, partial [Acrasis kona]
KQTTRNTFKDSKRVVVKIGSAILSREDQNGVSLSRIGNIIEQIFEVKQKGIEVIVVSSGAVAIGRQKLTEFKKITGSQAHVELDKRSCASAGQSGLMSLYATMFGYFGIGTSQVLVTGPDFKDKERLDQLRNTINVLLTCGAIPIVNENDVVSVKDDMLDTSSGIRSFNDNDGLASLIATVVQADLLILLSDVEGVYTSPPGTPGSILLHNFNPNFDSSRVKFEGRSKVGTGGMGSKILAAQQALDCGTNVVIANGLVGKSILDVIAGKRVGTVFSYHKDDAHTRDMAIEARAASRVLQSMTTQDRSEILLAIADALEKNQQIILEENQKDVEKEQSQLSSSSLARLKLDQKKLSTLIQGVRSIANAPKDPVGKTLRWTELSPNLELKQLTSPLGVLLIIFESRPDAVVQIASLAISSGNGLLLKGGKEASNSNRILHKVIVEAICNKQPKVPKGIIGLIESREEITELLALDDLIDLVIPRGSGELVSFIQRNTKIPVLGHSEGICHVYVDEHADLNKAKDIVVDSKTDYPAACNAMENLLVHKSLYPDGLCALVKSLQDAGVTVHAGPKLISLKSNSDIINKLKPAVTLKYEYSDLACAVEIVDSVQEAIDLTHKYGSSHTDCIVTQDEGVAQKWLREVDSACVFHNASTRFADGFRFGLGAEVGISTSRIHARGPVGVDGLLTTKWVLSGTGEDNHIVSSYSKGDKKFTHQSKQSL